MNTKARMVLIVVVALLGGMAMMAMTQAAPAKAPLSQGGAPAVVAYQGEVRVSGSPLTGDGYFKFAVVNAAGDTTYWSNDGTSTGGSEPTAAVQLAVGEGVFSVLLGDTTLSGMTQALTEDVFSQADRYLRVWFSASGGGPFDQLSPDTRIAAVPYALQAQEAANADTVDGLHASELGADYQNVVIVAKSGGDYTSVQTAIDSITDAAGDNAYLVWVAPGVYEEQVTMKPYVHLQGAGQEATVISSTASSEDFPPQATLVLASDASLRDLTVSNGGTGEYNAALLATAGMTRTLVADVTAWARGNGVSNYATVLIGSGVGVSLQQVTALAENGSNDNYGLVNYSGAAATLRGGTYTGRGGANACGIQNADSDTTLEAESVIALGEGGSSDTYGLYNYDGAAATLRGGSFTGRGGTNAYGIYNQASSAALEAESVSALGENGSSLNYGLYNYDAAAAVLSGGSLTGRGGEGAYGIFNDGSDTTLEAGSVTALGENGSASNFGLVNYDAAAAMLRGGSSTGRGGSYGYGIYNSGSSTTLDAEGVTALGENGSSYNRGLRNFNGAAATLRGGSFTGRGGADAYGIQNESSGTTLEAESVTALGENGSGDNYGLLNFTAATATLCGGVFTGRGGTYAYGIYNGLSGTTLEAESVTALGENSSNYNYGLANSSSGTANVTQSVLEGASHSVVHYSGSVTVSNSRLAGGAVSGTVTCVLVTRGTTISTDGSTCP